MFPGFSEVGIRSLTSGKVRLFIWKYIYYEKTMPQEQKGNRVAVIFVADSAYDSCNYISI